MTRSGSIRNVFVFLLFTMAAAAGAEEGARVANVDKDLLEKNKSAVAAPSVVEKYDYYTITGESEEELRSQMCRSGCTWSDGKKYDSVTNWHVKWDYGYSQTPKTCSADSFRATVEITYRYPHWARSDDVPRQLVDKWEGYMKSLMLHENGHRDLAVEAARELTRAVAAMPPASTCAEIDRNVRELCRLQLKKLKDDSNSYDVATRHGMTQGAAFP